MPKDVKFGLMLAVGVALMCGGKRISLDRDGDARSSVGGSSASIVDDLNLPNIAGLEKDARSNADSLTLNTGKTKDALVEKMDRASSDLQRDVDRAARSAQEESERALAKLSPKDLREKVEKSKEQAQERITDLELPDDLTAPAPSSAKTAPTKKSPAKDAPKPSPTKTSAALPIVKERDVKRPAPALPTDLGSLTLPDDELSRDIADPVAKESSRPKPARPMDDLPKPLPDADVAGLESTSARSGGPVHPYFLRFLKEGSYFVRDGDTLRSIAFNLYRDETRAGEILDLNREVLKAPTDLRAGMRLKLPRSN
jgi:nucleoid-associated protein YgaU